MMKGLRDPVLYFLVMTWLPQTLFQTIAAMAVVSQFTLIFRGERVISVLLGGGVRGWALEEVQEVRRIRGLRVVERSSIG